MSGNNDSGAGMGVGTTLAGGILGGSKSTSTATASTSNNAPKLPPMPIIAAAPNITAPTLPAVPKPRGIGWPVSPGVGPVPQVLGAPKTPELQPVVRMPTQGSAAVLAAGDTAQQEILARRGRSSTVLTNAAPRAAPRAPRTIAQAEASPYTRRTLG